MYRIGLDLGGTNIAAGIVNEKFEIVCKASIPTGAERSAAEITADMAAICHTVCEKAGIDPSEIESVGIASPGIANHDDGIVEYCCNIPSLNQCNVCEAVKASFPVKQVFVENDANAAAWGEAIAGAAKGTSDSIMITLGTGVGGGMIRDMMSSTTPAIFRKHIYAIASIVGAMVYYLLMGMNKGVAIVVTVILVTVLRVLATIYRWSLPKIRWTQDT